MRAGDRLTVWGEDSDLCLMCREDVYADAWALSTGVERAVGRLKIKGLLWI